MRCPFGCREAHRRRRSTRRSVAYYRTKEGRGKKRTQNGKRRSRGKKPDWEKEPDIKEADNGECNARIVEHVRMVTSLIERRKVSADEIVKMLARALRQPTHTRRRKIDYIVGYLNKASP